MNTSDLGSGRQSAISSSAAHPSPDAGGAAEASALKVVALDNLYHDADTPKGRERSISARSHHEDANVGWPEPDLSSTAGAFIPGPASLPRRTGTLNKNGPARSMAHDERAAISHWPEEAFEIYRDTVQVQDQFLATQTKLKSERDTVAARLSIMKDSLANLLPLLEPTKGQKAIRARTKQRKAAFDQFLIDQQAFDDQMQHVTKLEQSLGKLEYRLATLVPELLDSTDAYFREEERHQTTRPSGPSPLRRPEASSPPLTPLEQEYYDCRGAVRMLRDQLHNHQTELQTPPDNDVAVPVPPTLVTEDSGSYRQHAALQDRWRVEHQLIQEKLQDAEQQLERLWNACQGAGLGVGPLTEELPGPSMPALHLDSAQLAAIDVDPPPFLSYDREGLVNHFMKTFSWPPRGDFVAPKMPRLTDLNQHRELIESWVRKIPLGLDSLFATGPMTSPAAEFEHTVSTPRSEPEWSAVHKNDESASPKDYVTLTREEESAPNGEALQQSRLRRVLRKWRSDESLRPNCCKAATSYRCSASGRQELDLGKI